MVIEEPVGNRTLVPGSIVNVAPIETVTLLARVFVPLQVAVEGVTLYNFALPGFKLSVKLPLYGTTQRLPETTSETSHVFPDVIGSENAAVIFLLSPLRVLRFTNMKYLFAGASVNNPSSTYVRFAASASVLTFEIYVSVGGPLCMLKAFCHLRPTSVGPSRESC
jgi:hypothetical protein